MNSKASFGPYLVRVRGGMHAENINFHTLKKFTTLSTYRRVNIVTFEYSFVIVLWVMSYMSLVGICPICRFYRVCIFEFVNEINARDGMSN